MYIRDYNQPHAENWMAISKIEMPNKISSDNYLSGNISKASSSTADEKIADITIPSSGLWLIVLKKIYMDKRPIKISMRINNSTQDIASVIVGKTYTYDYGLLQLTQILQLNKNDVINVYGINDTAGGTHTIAYNFVKLLNC